jgi:preprotein translocase subunit SecF
MIQVTQKRNIFYIFSGVLLVISLFSIITWGMKYGLDFTGGSYLEVNFKYDRPTTAEVTDKLSAIKDLGSIIAQPIGDKGMVLRFKDVSEETHQQILSILKKDFKPAEPKNVDENTVIEEQRFESIGPTIGRELKNRAIIAIIFVLICIILYIAYAFRKVSRPVESWKFGVAAVVALAHDTIITIGVFSLLGHFMGVEIDSLFVTALLTLLGFSVHDTIVVFDRIRENLFKYYSGDFLETVNKSINDTLARSVNTSATVLLVLLSIYFLGGASIKFFALALIVGVVIGTYSSIFVASPLVVDWRRFDLWRAKKNEIIE